MTRKIYLGLALFNIIYGKMDLLTDDILYYIVKLLPDNEWYIASLLNKRFYRICHPFRQRSNPHVLRSFCAKRITSRPKKWLPVLGGIITSYSQGSCILERCIHKIISEVELVEKPARTAELVSCALPRIDLILSVAKNENVLLDIDAACTQRIIKPSTTTRLLICTKIFRHYAIRGICHVLRAS